MSIVKSQNIYKIFFSFPVIFFIKLFSIIHISSEISVMFCEKLLPKFLHLNCVNELVNLK